MDRDARVFTAAVLSAAVVALVLVLLWESVQLFIMSAFCDCRSYAGCQCDLGPAFALTLGLAVAAVISALMRLLGSRSSLLALTVIGTLSVVLGGIVVFSLAAATYENVGTAGAGMLLFGLAVAGASLLRFIQRDPTPDV